jgi:hypothetical protein
METRSKTVPFHPFSLPMYDQSPKLGFRLQAAARRDAPKVQGALTKRLRVRRLATDGEKGGGGRAAAQKP